MNTTLEGNDVERRLAQRGSSLQVMEACKELGIDVNKLIFIKALVAAGAIGG